MGRIVRFLEQEHRRIAGHLGDLEVALARLDLRTIRDTLDQLTWTISEHRQREAEILSPLPRAAVEKLLHRHRFEWEHLRAARRIFDVPETDTVELAPLLEACRTLVAELRDLIRHEELEVLPLAEDLPEEREDAALLAPIPPAKAP